MGRGQRTEEVPSVQYSVFSVKGKIFFSIIGIWCFEIEIFFLLLPDSLFLLLKNRLLLQSFIFFSINSSLVIAEPEVSELVDQPHSYQS